MRRSRAMAHDDQLKIPIGGRKDVGRPPRMPRIPHRLTPSPRLINAIVKVAYMRVGRTAGYVAYIERDGSAGPATPDGTTAAQGYSGYMAREGAGERGQRAALFTREGHAIDREAFVNRSVGDPRVWTLIVSPGRNDLDMERYVREFMLQLELDLGRRLDYLGATHRNTPFTHAHVVLRGTDRDGQEFRMPRPYIQHGLRNRATEIATRARELGWVRQPEAAHDGSPLTRLGHRLARWMAAHAREGRDR
jgi:hypothetical protein